MQVSLVIKRVIAAAVECKAGRAKSSRVWHPVVQVCTIASRECRLTNCECKPSDFFRNEMKAYFKVRENARAAHFSCVYFSMRSGNNVRPQLVDMEFGRGLLVVARIGDLANDWERPPRSGDLSQFTAASDCLSGVLELSRLQ